MSFRNMTTVDAKKFLWDAFERVGFTFLEGFLGVLFLRELDVSVLAQLDVWHAAVVGGANALIAAFKVWGARFFGNRHTASALPKRLDH